jgi:hypothetical protein
LVCYFPNTITVRFICMPFAVAKNYWSLCSITSVEVLVQLSPNLT